MKKKYLLPLLGIACLVSTVSCGGKKDSGSSQPSQSSVAPTSAPAEESAGDGSIELKAWVTADQFAQYKKLVTAYNATKAADKKIKLNLVGIGEGDIGDQIGNDATKMPDLFQLPGNNVQGFAEKNYIAQLDSVTTREGVNISESTWATGSVGGHVYALPYTINTYFLYFNKANLTSAEASSLTQILEKADDLSAVALGIDIGNGFYLQAVMRALGLNLYGEDGTTTDVLPTNENAVKLARFVWEVEHNTASYETVYGSFKDHVVQNKLLAAVDGTWNYGAYKDALGENLGCAVLPKIDIELEGEGTKKYTYNNQLGAPIDNKFIAVAAAVSGAKREAAVDFAGWLVSDESQRIRFEDSGIIPTSTALLADPSFKENFLIADAVNDYYASTANFANPTAAKFNSNFWNAASGFGSDLKGTSLTNWNEEKAKAAIKSFGDALVA